MCFRESDGDWTCQLERVEARCPDQSLAANQEDASPPPLPLAELASLSIGNDARRAAGFGGRIQRYMACRGQEWAGDLPVRRRR